MKFKFYKTSDYKISNPKELTIEIGSLSELLKLAENLGEIIIGKTWSTDPNAPHYFIEDYDDYRE